jgi:hypothetical protein
MSIPVRVDPAVKAHVARSGFTIRAGHALAEDRCPVCDEPLIAAPVSLVYVGRYPDDPGWTAAAVAVHDACTDQPAEANADG